MKNQSVVLKQFNQLLQLKYSGTTPLNYTSHVKRFLSFTDNAPMRVTNEDYLNYNVHMVKSNVSDSYRNVAINAINAYFKYYLHKKIKDFASIRPKKQNHIPRQIDHDLLTEKINNTINTKARLILTLGYCGLRSAEVINLKMKDVDIENNYVIVKGKGNKERPIPISFDTTSLMISYVDEYNPKQYLFNGRTNKREFKIQYSKGSILQLVKKNIGNYRFHDLRHSFAMRLLQNGVPLNHIQKLLGHEHLKTTQIYATATQNMLLGVAMPV
jgi:site-specific recombinase XerD